MKYTYKFRLYPTEEQERFLLQEAGNVRFVYNYLLALAIENYKKKKISWNYYKYKKLLPELKKKYEFLRLSNSQSLQEVPKNLNRAFENFFQGRSRFPKFKKKKKINSISIPQNFKIIDNMIKIPKLKSPIKFKKHREIEGEIKSISITIKPSGKYYLNILVDKEISPLPKKNKIIAIDMGLKNYITTSENQAISSPDCRKYERRLKILQRRLSRKKVGSNNYRKLSKKIARIYEKMNDIKNDFLHKLSRRIIDENQIIVIEKLDIEKMLKNKRLSRQIHQSGWYKFSVMLEYKAKYYGRELIKIDTFFPSSKLCHVCGYKNNELKLSDRKWTCLKCGAVHDRDYNAALNLLKEGMKQVGLEPSEFMPVEILAVEHS